MPAPDTNPEFLAVMTASSLAETRDALREHVGFCAARLAECIESGDYEDAEAFAHKVERAIAALKQFGWRADE